VKHAATHPFHPGAGADDPQDGPALRRQLNQLLALARDNEEKQRRFNALELRLIATSSLRELTERLLFELPSQFGLEQVTLTLVNRDDEVANLFAHSLDDERWPALQFVADAAVLAPLDAAHPDPWLGTFSVREHASRFPDLRQRPASVALLPLVRNRALVGSLNFGSLDPHRYAGGGSDFLARLGAIVAIAIENAANHERLRQLGFTDALTGVNNRRYFEERLAEEFAAAQRNGESLACMFLDVDHFKRFNDLHGHQAGDQALREVARTVRAQLRRGDTLSRYGGEEFVVLMRGASRRQAQESAERIRQAIAQRPFAVGGGEERHVTLSIGVSVLTPDRQSASIPDPATLVRLADQAVYAAKSGGRNRVVISDPLEHAFPWEKKHL
jgi:diguanylate cyclase (GGDEF)-like protein